MKKRYSLLITAILLAVMTGVSSAQTWTIAICSGGPPSVTTASTYGPMYSVATANATNRIAVIYPASQLTGIANQTLNAAYFYRGTASGTMAGTPNFKIYLKETSATDWGSGSIDWATETTGATLVYDSNPVTAVGSSAGWKAFTFSNSFFYSGSQNLAVFMEYTNSTASTAIAWSYEYTSSCINTGNSNTTKYANVTTGVLPTTLGTSNYRRPYIGFDGVTAACTNPPTGGTATVSPTGTLCQGVPITLNLTGNSAGANMTYEWESSPTDVPFTPTSLGAASAAASLTINTTSTLWYRAKLVCSGGTPEYSAPVQVTVAPAYPGGTYTINDGAATGGTNFHSFAEAVSAISCGIAGPVVLNVVSGSGPYNEQVNLPFTIGATSTNTVTFNGNGCTLTQTLTGTPANNATLNLDGADYITFNDMNIEALGSTYGIAVHLMNSADNNSFNNCNFSANATATGTATGCVNMSGSATSYSTAGTNGMNNTFTGCTTTGGYFGFVFYGTSPAGNTNNSIINCTIKDFYVYGSYNVQQGSATISGNLFDRATRSGVSTFYGVYLSTGCNDMLVENNRMRNAFTLAPTSTSTGYGIYCSADASAGMENKLINNVISDFTSNGTQGGLYLTGSDYVHAYHNTISLDDASSTAGTTYGIYATGTAGVDLKDNNVYITRGGTGSKYCLYFTGAGKTSDYNNLFINSPAGTNNVGYYSTTTTSAATLAAWQAVNSNAWDQNSASVNPIFANATSGDYTPGNSLLDNIGTPVGVLTDINGATRSTTNPDIGAYEFTVNACNGNPVAGTATASVTNACLGGPISISLSGFTIGSGISIQWQSSPLGAGSWTNISGATTSLYSDVFSGAMDYRAEVTCMFGGGVDYSNTISINQNPFYNCYCSPNTGVTLHGTTGNYISNVNIPTTTLNNSTSAVGPGGYLLTDPSIATNTATLIQGQTYTLNATISSASYSTELWIDWDQSGTFDAGEYQLLTPGTLATTSISVPLTSGLGQTGMRLRNCASSTTTFGASGACDNISIGRETEDYVITITPIVQCSGTPSTAGTAAANITTICNNGDVALSLTGYPTDAGIEFQWESSPAGQNNFSAIANATGTGVYTATGVNASTDFRMAATCTNPGGGTAYSNVISVTVNSPALASTTGGSRCGTGTVDLNATTGSGNVNWYDVPTGGTPLYTGTTFTTPSISATTDFYAAATDGGYSAYVGKASLESNAGTGGGLTSYIIFDALSNFTIQTVDIYPYGTGAGTVTIQLRDASGTTLMSQLVNVTGTTSTASPAQTVTLNFPVTPGSNYRLGVSAWTGGVTNLYRDASNLSYPYTLPGVVSITASSLSGYYYFFYNWHVSTGCEGPRTAVTAIVNPAPAYTITATPDTVCQGNSSTLAVNSANAYSYTWTPGGGTSSSISVTPAATATYYVSGIDVNNCTIDDSVTVNVKSVPATVNTIAAQNTLCVSGLADLSLNPVPMAGIGIQWQRNTGSGFTDIAGASSNTFSETITAGTSYQANLYCNGNLVGTSTPVSITVNNTAAPTVFPGSRCDAGPVTLAAQGATGTSINWYDVPAGGSPIGTGGVYTTPSLTATTTYYAAAVGGGGGLVYGGKSAPVATATGYSAAALPYGLVFDVTTPFTLLSVDVYSSASAGSLTAVLTDNTGAILTTIGPIAIPAGTGTTIGGGATATTIPINYPLAAGTGYRLYTTNLTATLIRENTGGYPYPIGTIGTVSTSWTNGAASSANYYFFYNWKVSSGCESPRVSVNATITGAASGTLLATGGTTTGSLQADGTTVDYMDGCNDKVASVTDAAGGNVLGTTYATVLAPGTVQVFGSQPYVPRVYDISPSSSGAATVSIYALQSEFDAYNNYVTTNNLSYPLLPTGPSDVAGIANIAVTQFHGSPGAGTTGPGGVYNATQAELVPNSSIVSSWNGSYWTLTFPVSGFSGFFIHSGTTPLAIVLRDISAMNAGNRNRIDWSTETEDKGDYFVVQRSIDGKLFTDLGTVATRGAASLYSYWDETPVNGTNYYRLKIAEASGHISFSKVVSATVRNNGSFTVEAYPNPVNDKLTIKVYGAIADNAYVTITDAAGKLVRSVHITNAESAIDMNGLAQGVYLIKYADDHHTQNLKVNKQ